MINKLCPNCRIGVLKEHHFGEWFCACGYKRIKNECEKE